MKALKIENAIKEYEDFEKFNSVYIKNYRVLVNGKTAPENVMSAWTARKYRSNRFYAQLKIYLENDTHTFQAWGYDEEVALNNVFERAFGRLESGVYPFNSLVDRAMEYDSFANKPYICIF